MFSEWLISRSPRTCCASREGNDAGPKTGALRRARKALGSIQAEAVLNKAPSKLKVRKQKQFSAPKAPRALYNLDNIVATDRPQRVLETVDELKRQPTVGKILIPDFKCLRPEFYRQRLDDICSDVEEGVDEHEEEDDVEEHYTALHRPSEIAEICGYYLREQATLPPHLQNGLKVRIQLHSGLPALLG
jgi:hypothetical protein